MQCGTKSSIRKVKPATCQQRTLTPPDTWSCPFLGLACALMLRPISPELVLFSGLLSFELLFCILQSVYGVLSTVS